MKLSVVALFAAGAMAAVVPEGGSYGEAPAPAETPAQSSSPEAPAAPEGGSYGEEEQPAPTSKPVEEESPEQPSTVLDTEVVATVTDCGPEVTDCAAPEDVTSTVEVTTSICETESEAPSSAQPTEAPSAPESESPQPTSSEEECEEEETSAPAPYPEQPTKSEAPKPSAPMSTGSSSPEKPTSSVCLPETKVKTITTEYTTVVPTTILETETVPCPEPTEEAEYPEGPTGGSAAPTEGTYPEPSESSSPSAPGNETASPEESAPVTAGAGALAGSIFTAAVAGVVAFAFA